MIDLVVFPGEPPWSWERFVTEAPRFSVALDGFVASAPRFDDRGPHVNFNHHEDVDRLATRSTCAQVLMAIRQGLFDVFRDDQGPRALAYVNDCDEDVCTSWYLLSHHYLCQQSMNPRLNRLVALEDVLDATAGAYPFPVDAPALRELAWIFEPYRQFRMSGQIDRRDDQSPRRFRSVIDDVTHRIEQHVIGGGGELPIDARYERIGGGQGWALVREIGAQARTGLFADGIRAYVAARPRDDGRWSYTVGRMSPFVRFRLEAIYDTCNAAEGAGENTSMDGDTWGGSDTVGGSPRIRGSRISPDELSRLIDEVSEEPCPQEGMKRQQAEPVDTLIHKTTLTDAGSYHGWICTCGKTSRHVLPYHKASRNAATHEREARRRETQRP